MDEVNLNKELIYSSIPHRDPFLFVDKVVKLDETSIVAERTFSKDEYFFKGHYPENPITPGVLLCESVFQVAGILLKNKFIKDGNKKFPVLAKINEAKFKRIVKPGELLQIEVNFEESLKDFYFLKGSVKKDCKVAMTVKFALTLIEG